MTCASRSIGNAASRVPFVWSDLYGSRLQLVGVPGQGEPLIRHGGPYQDRWVALFGRDGALCAAVALDWPRPLMHYRKLIAAGASWTDALTSEPPGL